jgi:hypothetical protein
MLLCEIFKTIGFTVPYEKHSEYNSTYYSFYIGGKNLTVVFTESTADSWLRKFYPNKYSIVDDALCYHVTFIFDGSFKLTGEKPKSPGEPHNLKSVPEVAEIFNNVIASCVDFVNTNKVSEFDFSAKEKSRIKFYDRLVVSIGEKINFKLAKVDDDCYICINMNYVRPN